MVNWWKPSHYVPYLCFNHVLVTRDLLIKCIGTWWSFPVHFQGFPQRMAQWRSAILLAMFPCSPHFVMYVRVHTCTIVVVSTHVRIRFLKVLLPRGKVSWSCDNFFFVCSELAISVKKVWQVLIVILMLAAVDIQNDRESQDIQANTWLAVIYRGRTNSRCLVQ